jgi:hypothetical protein
MTTIYSLAASTMDLGPLAPALLAFPLCTSCGNRTATTAVVIGQQVTYEPCCPRCFAHWRAFRPELRLQIPTRTTPFDAPELFGIEARS